MLQVGLDRLSGDAKDAGDLVVALPKVD